MMDESEGPNPRATVIISRTEDEERLESMLMEIEKMDSLDLPLIFQKFNEIPAIKEEPAFMENLFLNNLALVKDIIEWMLLPKIVIKRTNIKGNYQQFPYRCKELMKNNWCFYEQVYISARNGRLPLTFWFKFLREEYRNESTLDTALGYFDEVMTPFAKYEFSGSMNVAKVVGEECWGNQPTFESLLSEIISFAHYEPIFKFIHTGILVSLEDPNDTKICMKALTELFSRAKTVALPKPCEEDCPKKNVQTMCDFIENLMNSMKQTIENIDEQEISTRLEYYLGVFGTSKMTEHFITMIAESRICQKGQLGKKCGDVQENVIEYLLTILTYIVDIYYKISKQYEYAFQIEKQVRVIFQKIPQMSKLVNHPQAKSIPLSSGQNIKCIGFMKFAYFKLLLSCLKLEERFPSFQVPIDKFPIVSILERYLVENRWNNLVHHTLEKICQSLMKINLKIFINKQTKQITDGFLGYLIENFNNKNYIFLNTFNFTNQGNLHSLYMIAKKLAYQLKNSHQLMVSLQQSEPWKKFLLTDLRKYEERVFAPTLKPEEEDYQIRKTNSSFECLQVDEFDSIKKLIDNISSAKKKWPVRDSYKKKTSNSAIFRKSGDGFTYSSGEERNNRSFGFPSQRKQSNHTFNSKKLDGLIRKISDSRIKHHQSFEIDQFQLVMLENGSPLERQKSKMSKSDILKSLSLSPAHNQSSSSRDKFEKSHRC